MWGFFRNPFVIVALAFSIAPLVLGLVGAGLYAREVKHTHTYREASCFVYDTFIEKDTCSSQSCSGSSSSRRCHTNYYTCYTPYWEVIYYPEDAYNTTAIITGTQTSSYSNAFNDQKKHLQGETYDCYYDSTDYDDVQWTFPNPKPWLIMMSVCLPVFGALWLGVGAYFIYYRFNKAY